MPKNSPSRRTHRRACGRPGFYTASYPLQYSFLFMDRLHDELYALNAQYGRFHARFHGRVILVLTASRPDLAAHTHLTGAAYVVDLLRDHRLPAMSRSALVRSVRGVT